MGLWVLRALAGTRGRGSGLLTAVIPASGGVVGGRRTFAQRSRQVNGQVSPKGNSDTRRASGRLARRPPRPRPWEDGPAGMMDVAAALAGCWLVIGGRCLSPQP